MAAQMLIAPFCQFIDSNGAPLAGGSVYTYAAGTTTPKNTYTDSTAATPNANPVILDSAGRASIWLSGSYKIVVKDSLGNTIGTPADNVASVAATGDMLASVYDPANIAEQLVGLTAVQTLTNKTVIQKGTITNDSAAAGIVGEIIESTLASGSATSLVTGTSKTITSISLTAGDWDVFGNVVFVPAASTTNSINVAGVSTSTNALPTPPAGGYASQPGITSLATSVALGVSRQSLSSTTTVYLIGNATFATSTLTAYGYIGARRVR